LVSHFTISVSSAILCFTQPLVGHNQSFVKWYPLWHPYDVPLWDSQNMAPWDSLDVCGWRFLYIKCWHTHKKKFS
jgi:hypothetical protein